MCRYCNLAIYFTGVLYRLKHGSNTYVCFGAGSPNGMHAR
jgi:hypothetical protein